MARLLTWPLDHPRAAVLAMVLLALASAAGLRHAWFDFSLERLYPQESPLARFHAEHLERFARADDVLFAVREGDPFDPGIAGVEAQIAALDGVDGTLSPLSLRVLDGSGGVVRRRPLAPGEDHPQATGAVVAVGGGAGAVIARIDDAHNHHQARDALVSEIEAVVAAEGGTWHLGGIPVIRTAYVRLMLRDMFTLVPLAVLVSAGFFISSFRDLRHVAVGVGAVGLGAAAAAAAYAATGTPFNVFAPAFVAVIVVVGTSDVVHLVHRFTDRFAELGDTDAAARVAAREVGAACALTSTTTAVGFLALLTTQIPPIRVFGLATGIGVILTFVTTFLVVPLALRRLGPPAGAASRHATRSGARMAAVGRWAVKRRRGLLVASAVVTAGFAGLASTLQVQHRILEDVRSASDVALAQDIMEEQMGAVLPLEVALRFDGDPREPEAVAAVAALTDWLRERPMVGHAIGLPDLLGAAWQTLSGEPGLPPTRAAVAQTELVLELGGEDPVPAFLVEHPPGSGQWHGRVSTRVRDVGNAPTLALVSDLDAFAAEVLAPVGIHATATGVAYLAQEVNTTLTRQFGGSFAIALGLVTLVWLALTRSLRRTLVALVPNVVPLVALLGAMGAIGLALKPSTAMVLSIGLGIAVDDTIHFLSRYLNRRRTGAEVEDAVVHAYATAGRSMFDTSLVLCAGFGIFVFAGFVASFNFGVLTAWTVAAALFTDLFLLGPLIVTVEGWGAPRPETRHLGE